jgi:hypothetical protein
MSGDLERLPYGLKFGGLLALEFLPDFFKPRHIITGIQPLTAMQTHFNLHAQNGRVVAPAKEFLDFFLD